MVQEEGRSSSGGAIKDAGMNDKLNFLIDEIDSLKDSDKKGKEKKFNFNKSKGKLKKNYVMVIYVHTNKHMEIKYLPIKDNAVFIKEKGVYHPILTDYIFWHKNYPTVVIHEDQTMPVHPDTLFGKASINDIRGQKVIFALCKEAQIKAEKKPMNFGAVLIIIVVIAIVIGAYFLLKKK